MVEFFAGQAVGFAMGLIGSFFSWWVLTHYLVPKVEFGTFISRSSHGLNGDKIGYRFKFVNRSKRPIYEIVVTANVIIYKLIPGRKDNSLGFRIPLNLSGETEIFYPMMKSGGNRIPRLSFEVCQSLKISEYIPKQLRDTVESGNFRLEDLLAIGDEPAKNKFFIYVLATDALSGARKVFRSKDYHAMDILDTTFKGLEPKVDPR